MINKYGEGDGSSCASQQMDVHVQVLDGASGLQPLRIYQHLRDLD